MDLGSSETTLNQLGVERNVGSHLTKLQAPSNKLDKTSQIIYDEDIMRIRKKLVKEIKKTNPDLADEIKYMSVKDFKMLMFVFNVWCRL